MEYILKEQAFEAVLKSIELTGEEWIKIWDEIKNISPADVIEVVKCECCRWYNKSDIDYSGDLYYCDYHDMYVYSHDYCSYGVRMDGD